MDGGISMDGLMIDANKWVGAVSRCWRSSICILDFVGLGVEESEGQEGGGGEDFGGG